MAERDGIVMPEPLAYFLTWPTYGTWLPGDARGWVKHQEGQRFPDPARELEARAEMTADACSLDEGERGIVEQTIMQHCAVRGWTLHAVSCRSNHLHVVVSAGVRPEEVRRQLKAWTVRKLKQHSSRGEGGVARPAMTLDKWWAERGSSRYLNDERSLEAAILYVSEAQDRPH